MMERLSGLDTLLIEKDSLDSEWAETLRPQFQRVQVLDRVRPADYSQYDSSVLILTRHHGRFLKPCPGTRGYNCCGLQIIHFGLGCPLNCTYCILQSYLDTRALVLFSNVEEGLSQLKHALDAVEKHKRTIRYSTGEFTDSLLLEDLTGLGARLVSIFSKYRHASLELKTKTDNVQSLIGLEHNGRSIISFSVNAPAVAASEESEAVSLKRRLAAAETMVGEGYRVGFHFDPLIRHPEWRKGYARTVSDIFSVVPAEKIAWISLGGFRFPPKLKLIVARNHADSRIIYDEFVLAPDGKMRYYRPLRVEMYRHMVAEIRGHSPEACIYLCMENPRVWREVFGYDPRSLGLIQKLHQRV
ncbi:MAG: DNA photolyase [Deltaproteobacteria bacterium]|nr:DNA photolyase [Deltaproteobacteria bacterium]